MDDEFEDKVFYQTYVSHMKILSKFAVGLSSINSPLLYIWKLCRLYILRPEIIVCGMILFLLLVYLQAVDIWSHAFLERIQTTFGLQKIGRLKFVDEFGDSTEHQYWEEVRSKSSAFAVLGRRPRMEDRFILEENINNTTGISFFAVFDGHGGEFAADFAKDVLSKNIFKKIVDTIKVLKELSFDDNDGDSLVLNNKSKINENKEDDKEINESNILRQMDRRTKPSRTTENCNNVKQNMFHSISKKKPEDVFTSKLNSLIRSSGKPVNRAFKNSLNDNNKGKPSENIDPRCYIENGKINFGKLISDEIVSTDYKLIEMAKKTTNIAGTTALIAIIHGNKLVVANVGDSRGVMCDSRGLAIPLSFDHKPQQIRERKRIHDAGGFIAFRGVWRVAGILATSRALGDYPLKERNLVIANPDILTFDLDDHKPHFIILASDGLWDTFSNEEACNFITEHINEPDFGAKSLAMQSYQRGSVDNITVLVVVFKNGKDHGLRLK